MYLSHVRPSPTIAIQDMLCLYFGKISQSSLRKQGAWPKGWTTEVLVDLWPRALLCGSHCLESAERELHMTHQLALTWKMHPAFLTNHEVINWPFSVLVVYCWVLFIDGMIKSFPGLATDVWEGARVLEAVSYVPGLSHPAACSFASGQNWVNLWVVREHSRRKQCGWFEQVKTYELRVFKFRLCGNGRWFHFLKTKFLFSCTRYSIELEIRLRHLHQEFKETLRETKLNEAKSRTSRPKQNLTEVKYTVIHAHNRSQDRVSMPHVTVGRICRVCFSWTLASPRSCSLPA